MTDTLPIIDVRAAVFVVSLPDIRQAGIPCLPDIVKECVREHVIWEL